MNAMTPDEEAVVERHLAGIETETLDSVVEELLDVIGTAPSDRPREMVLRVLQILADRLGLKVTGNRP